MIEGHEKGGNRFILQRMFRPVDVLDETNRLAKVQTHKGYTPCVSVCSRLQWKQWLTPRMATLQVNKNKEGVHIVVPPELANFFIASASAGAALVGLLFVAVSIAPEHTVARRAPMERQAVAGSAFTALINAFFISLVALIPHVNFGLLIFPFISVFLLSSLMQAWQLLRLRKGWPSFLRRAFLVFLSLVLYGFELVNALQLINDPSQVGYVYSLVFLLLGAFALGLVRAWELLGVHRYGLFGWLNPLRDVNDTESFSRAGNSHVATGHPKAMKPHPVHHLSRVFHEGKVQMNLTGPPHQQGPALSS